MEIAEENTTTPGIPLMIDPTFLSDKGMPIWYATAFGTRYYGKTPTEVEKRLRELIPETPRRREEVSPWTNKRRAQAAWASRRVENDSNDYMNVPFLNVLGLPNSMKNMKVKKVQTRRNSLKDRLNDMLRDVRISPKKKKTRKATRLLVSRGERA